MTEREGGGGRREGKEVWGRGDDAWHWDEESGRGTRVQYYYPDSRFRFKLERISESE